MCALALSVAAHLALGFAIGTRVGMESGAGSIQLSEKILTVQLKKSGVPAKRSKLAPAEYEKSEDAILEKAAEPLQTVPHVSQMMPIFLISGQTKPHYFRARELTEKPYILNDVSSNASLNLPGVPAQSAVLRLLINERGDIDRVVVEKSYLPDYAAQLVVDAFSKAKFHPGQIGKIPVNSQLRIEITLENVMPEP